MSQILLSPISFLNAFEIESSMNLRWNVIKTLCRQYESNRIVRNVCWLEFARNIAKFNIDQTICNADKDRSKFTKWTIWISPYCPWLKFFKNISSSKKRTFGGNLCKILEGTIWFKLYFILIWVAYICFW